jgi:hypothetical protein
MASVWKSVWLPFSSVMLGVTALSNAKLAGLDELVEP